MSALPAGLKAPIGLLILGIGVLVIVQELHLSNALSHLLFIPVTLLVVLLSGYVSRSRQVFVVVAVLLTLMNLGWNPDWRSTLEKGFATAGFIATFFAALSTLKFAAASSPAIRRSGLFLSQQPPGRRYLALTVGGQLFGLLLNYGAIQLLGAMSVSSIQRTLDPEIRRHRVRRMLLAIQRGFISILPWSPFSFAILISTTLVPGASWTQAALPGLVNGIILAGLGWLLDQLFKPRLASPPPPRAKLDDNWSALLPLLFLLLLLAALLALAYLLTGIRILVLEMLIIPTLSMAWVLVQTAHRSALKHLRRRTKNYLTVQLAELRGELILLMMAGYLGTLASPLLGEALQGLGVNLLQLPAWLILIGIVWLIPLAGQFGMNPILVAAVIAPLIPDASQLSITPSAIVTAITAGWILSGVSSPFTATTLLVGKFADVSSFHVGQRWNGGFTLLCAVVLSAWVVAYASWV